MMCAGILALVSVERMVNATIEPAPFMDTDTYSRMVRVVDLWQTGDWYDATYDRILPDGLESHWTRPLDAAIVLLAVPLSWVMPDRLALHWAGWFIAPVFCLLTVAVLTCALRRVLSPPAVVFSGVGVLLAFPMFAVFTPTRPDHYPPLILVFAVMLWGLITLFSAPGWRRGAVAIGAALVLAIWVNISGAMLALAIPVALGVRWLVSGGDWARRNLWVAGAATVTCLIALFIERPPLNALTAVEFDRLSVAHLVLFAVIAAFWTGVEAVGRRYPGGAGHIPGRALHAAPLALVGVAALLLAFPQVLGPDHGIPIDPLYARTRLAWIGEYRPLVTAADFETVRTATLAVAAQAGYLMPAVLGTLGLLVLLVRGPAGVRWVWGILLALAVIYTALAWPPVAAWITMSTAVVLPGYGVVLGGAFAAFERAPMLWRVLSRAGVILVLGLGPSVLQTWAPGQVDPEDAYAFNVCGFTPLGEWLAEAFPATDPPMRVMTWADLGGELLYRTPHAVYALPNHRRQPGYDMIWRVMTAPDQRTAREEILSAAADILIVCESPNTATNFEQIGDSTGFRVRLLAGEVPDWLTPLETPESIPDTVRVFRVAPAAEER
jgi:hypothetical protein